MGVLSELKPYDVFNYFELLCSVPHGSGNTKIISDLIVNFAKEQGLKYHQDDLNNVIIYKDATPGYENAPTYIIQGHMDMVCAKTDDCTKDMTKEGLDLRTDGVHVWADKTTLGGDDCIAVACAMALLADKSLKHPAIEAVFTVDEETGMGGAFGLDYSLLKGKRLLNLDSEEDGVFTVSCAGGCRVHGLIENKQTEIPEGYLLAKIKTSNFKGGHSGCDIVDGRGSAIMVLAQFLHFASTHNDGMLLVSAEGGFADNVICTNAQAIIAAPAEAINSINSMSLRFREKIKEELGSIDPDAELSFELIGKPPVGSKATNLAKTQKILSSWNKFKYGVQAMLEEFGIPLTSQNMGIMKLDEEGWKCDISVRSAIQSERDKLIDENVEIIKQAGGKVELTGKYPSWPYIKDSAYRDLAAKVYENVTGAAPGMTATHGGLECGLFIEKIPGLEAISLGPDLKEIHSPREILDVKSTEKLYNFVCKLLEESK